MSETECRKFPPRMHSTASSNPYNLAMKTPVTLLIRVVFAHKVPKQKDLTAAFDFILSVKKLKDSL